jgi:hypothetical protein
VLEKLVTPSGLEFRGESWVTIRGEDCPLDALSEEQREFVATCVELQGLRGAFAGQAECSAPGLPALETLFPDLAREP